MRTRDTRYTRVRIVADSLICLFICGDGETKGLVVTVCCVDLGQWGECGGECVRTHAFSVAKR